MAPPSGGLSVASFLCLFVSPGCCLRPDGCQTLRQQSSSSCGRNSNPHISEVDRGLDGVLGVAILDLKAAAGNSFCTGDDVFPQASSIKIAVLAELYRQAQAGKLKLTDLYTVQATDLVPDSDIMGGLTPGVTRITSARPGHHDGCGERQQRHQCSD